MQQLKYWVWLSALSGVGAITARRLVEHFGDAERVFLADAKQYEKVDGVKTSDLSVLMSKSFDRAEAILADCEKMGCHIVTFFDERYPERLKNIYDPPIILYVKGNLPNIDAEPVVGIVGTRDCTKYGLDATESISYKLAGCGIIVTTGLAKGIDSAAAKGALRAGGRVIGVIGSGHGVIYPPENKELFEAVVNSGAIISEYPPKTPAHKAFFPARNRLVSGISLGVAVIEAPKRSGALITAFRALEQGRDVFTLPGNVGAISSEGSNLLLRDGAIAILSAEDIISEYEMLFPDKIKSEAGENKYSGENNAVCSKRGLQADIVRCETDTYKKEIDNITRVEYIDVEEIIATFDGDERIVAETIKLNSVHIDEIISKSGLDASRVLTAITMLEIKGCILSSKGKFYSLKKTP